MPAKRKNYAYWSLVNCAAVIFGVIFGVLVAKFMKDDFKKQLSMIFGFCAIAIGVRGIASSSGSITTAVLAFLIEYIIGNALKFEIRAQKMFSYLARALKISESEQSTVQLVTALILFYCGDFARHAVMTEAILETSQLLYAKSVA